MNCLSREHLFFWILVGPEKVRLVMNPLEYGCLSVIYFKNRY